MRQPIGTPVFSDLSFSHDRRSSVRRIVMCDPFGIGVTTQPQYRLFDDLFPNIHNWRRIAIPLGQWLQAKIVFDRAQHAVMCVMTVQDFGILLAFLLYHVPEKQRKYPVVGIVIGLIKRHYHQRALAQLLGERFIEKLAHPRGSYSKVRVVAVVIHIWGVERIGHQAHFRISDEQIILTERAVALAGINPHYPVAPFFLHLRQAEKGHMASHIIAFMAMSHMLAVDSIWTIPFRQFFGIVLEIQTVVDQAIGDSLVRSIVREVDLPVRKIASPSMDAEVRARNHRQITWIRGMEQRMKV